MRWDAVELARFARGAGFAGEQVTVATALALATSGGIASYDFRAGSPGVGHYVGLWGLDVDRWPEYAGRDLLVPFEAARVAHELWESTGGWEWCPIYGTDHHYAMLDRARLSTSDLTRYQAPALAFTIPHTDRALRAEHERLATFRHTLSTFAPPRR